jgi:mono/diheme cytochrome c family protein
MRLNQPKMSFRSSADQAQRCQYRLGRWTLSGVILIALSGCRSEMYDQPRYEPLEPSTFFEDGTSARPLVAGTVPRLDRGDLPQARDQTLFLTGMTGGHLATTPPYPVDRHVLDRGRERYRIFCTPCHGELGNGRGIVVQRGFTPPPTFHGDDLRKAPLGHFFQVITHGHGVMYSYASRVPPQDRWAIAAYVRALQLSQHAVTAELPAEDQRKLQEAMP